MAVGPQLTATLKRYGLESLTKWASNALIQGLSEAEIMLQMYDQPTFKSRFKGIFDREAAGYPPISIDQYLEYEQRVAALGRTWGLELSKAEVDNLIGQNISAMEVEQRFNIAATAVFESDPETRNELARMFNIGTGDLMRYWMNPSKGLGDLQNKYRMGEIAGAALRSGYGQITTTQAQRLQEAGLDRNQSLAGFGRLTEMAELFSALDTGERDILDDEQLSLLTGDAEASRIVEQRQRRRVAEFSGGGGFAQGQTGFATGEDTSV